MVPAPAEQAALDNLEVVGVLVATEVDWDRNEEEPLALRSVVWAADN